jgi:hypothetical protein
MSSIEERINQAKELQELAFPTVLRVADYFPAVLPPCKEVAAKFFYCFSTEGAQQDPLVSFLTVKHLRRG